MLFILCSCAAAVVKEPQPVYVVNTKFMVVAKGSKNFNYKKGHDQMTAWVEKPKEVKWSELPDNLIMIPLETWLKKIVPALKELARKYRDSKN